MVQTSPCLVGIKGSFDLRNVREATDQLRRPVGIYAEEWQSLPGDVNGAGSGHHCGLKAHVLDVSQSSFAGSEILQRKQRQSL